MVQQIFGIVEVLRNFPGRRNRNEFGNLLIPEFTTNATYQFSNVRTGRHEKYYSHAGQPVHRIIFFHLSIIDIDLRSSHLLSDLKYPTNTKLEVHYPERYLVLNKICHSDFHLELLYTFRKNRRLLIRTGV